MDYDSLTGSQKRAYDEALTQSHHREVELRILTLSGIPVQSLTNAFLGGSIQGDSSRTPAEVLECEVMDNDYSLDWHNGEFRKYMVRIIDGRFIPALDDWVDRVVFTGPIWDFDREGPVVSLVAHGAERLAMGSVRRVISEPRKTRATAVVRKLLVAAGAQSRDLSIPALAAKLPERVTIGVRRGKKKKTKKEKRQPLKRIYRADLEDTYWTEAERIAEAINRDLFPDGRGKYLLRAPVTRPQVSFTKQTTLKPATERRGTDGEVPNTWLVLGANPKGPKKRVEAKVHLSSRHNLSAQSLAWNGTPREVIERIENKQIRTVKAARDLGEKYRDRMVRELVEYEVECLPCVTWLRPDSMASIPIEVDNRVAVRVRQWTLPLGPGADPLVIGANRRTTRRNR